MFSYTMFQNIIINENKDIEMKTICTECKKLFLNGKHNICNLCFSEFYIQKPACEKIKAIIELRRKKSSRLPACCYKSYM